MPTRTVVPTTSILPRYASPSSNRPAKNSLAGSGSSLSGENVPKRQRGSTSKRKTTMAKKDGGRLVMPPKSRNSLNGSNGKTVSTRKRQKKVAKKVPMRRPTLA